MPLHSNDRLVDLARTISRETLATWAGDVDTKGRFPAESLQAIKQAGLLSYFVPERFGGPQGDFNTFWRIAAAFGEGCLSSALIWAMHSQQVAVLADHAAHTHADVLAAIAGEGLLVASVTSEEAKGGDLWSAECALIPEENRLRLERFAPIVSYGAEASLYLVTARAQADRPLNDVRLVLVKPGDGTIKARGDWNSMGMRGTRSIPMEFNVAVNPDRLLKPEFRTMMMQTMVPVGHLGWAAAWFGAARGVFNRFVLQLRGPATRSRKKLGSDLFGHRLARLRLSLDMLEAMISQTAVRLDRQRGASLEAYEDLTFSIGLNNLKVAASELSFTVVNGLMELAGLAQGYLQEQPLGLERTFRDLRSASLMYHNDRLLEANGKLLIIEPTAMQAVWQK